MIPTTKYYLLGLALIAISCEQIGNKTSNTTLTDTTMIREIPPLNYSNSFVFQSKIIDTLVNVGNHKLHFRIVKGKGIPILFENGAGDNCAIWDTILKPLAEITGTTLITYDRAGFGKSTIDKLETNNSKHGILSGLEDLETALKIIGYDNEIILVSHSYGGYITTLYSERHPNLVKSIVLIDVNHNFHEKYAEKEVKDHEQETNKLKNTNPGFYYLATNFLETSKFMATHTIPKDIPVVDFVSGISFQEDKEKTEHWIECHKSFVANHPKSIGITAFGCGHYIWINNPGLVITTIAKSYLEKLEDKQKIIIYNHALNYAIVSANETILYNKSENYLNSWGYMLLLKGENIKALEIFKLNVVLHPLSSDAYESYGEALLKDNQKEEAIKMYRKSIELDPENEDAKKVLAEHLKTK